MPDPSAALADAAARVGALLRQRGETVAIAESSSGGLISAALLALPGASAFFRGGGVVYTSDAKSRLLDLSPEALANPRAATEAHARLLAGGVRARLDATWGIGETGAAGPTGNRYGDAPGHSCLAVDGLRAASTTIETGSADRAANMALFATAALSLLAEQLDAS